MKNMLKKLGYGALILMAVIGLIYTFTLDRSTPAQPEVTSDPQTLLADPTTNQATQQTNTFSDLSYTVGDISLHFARNNSGQWMWKDDPDFPLDPTELEALSQALETLQSQKTIPVDDATDLADYGLANPWASITATYQDETTLTLNLGNATVEQQAYYATKNGDESTMYIYGADWTEVLMTPIYDLCQLPDFPTWSGDTVENVVVTEGETVLRLALVDGDTWRDEDTLKLVDAPDLLSCLESFQLVKCFSFKPTDKAVSICGLETPLTTLSVAYPDENGETVEYLVYFGTLAMDASYRYVRYNDDTTIYLVEDQAVTAVLELLA